MTVSNLGGMNATTYSVELASLNSSVIHLVEYADDRVLKSEVSYLLEYLPN